MAAINDLRRAVQAEVFDYQQLIDSLRRYASPRDKITRMLRSGEIIRVKKGLYVFGEDYRRGPWSKEVLANLIYGPSYISLDYALSFYRLIPERVEIVTSVTTAKTRQFDTFLGRFTYRTLALRKYNTGVDQQTLEPGRHFLIASPAKALVDKVWADTRFTPRKGADFDTYLKEDLRVDPDQLAGIDRHLLDLISEGYGARKIRLLGDYLRTQIGDVS